VYYVLIIANVLMSWFRFGNNIITRFIYEMTEPVLGFFRRLIPIRSNMPFDFSPFIAILALKLLETLLRSVIRF